MADKEEYTLKIMIEPTNSPCETCKGCSWFERCESTCEKLAAFNNKIMSQEHDYDEAIERIKKSLKRIQCWPDSFNDSIAEAALNALLEGVKKWK